ncbi:MAG: hypothetical protein LC104_07910, partial [Bacteroidales bacterium]|nr:hypothetical protein [Bacteroidales bacterium]
LRAVHVCWDEQLIQQIAEGYKNQGGLSNTFLLAACRKGPPLYSAVDAILKGKEGKLPDGVTFADKDGHVRTEFRTRWYMTPEGQTYRTYALQTDVIPCDQTLDPAICAAATPYPESAKPAFVGHYWLSADRPSILASNVACLDYSVAKGGFLCAYRWQGEPQLDNSHFVWTRKNS